MKMTRQWHRSAELHLKSQINISVASSLCILNYLLLPKLVESRRCSELPWENIKPLIEHWDAATVAIYERKKKKQKKNLCFVSNIKGSRGSIKSGRLTAPAALHKYYHGMELITQIARWRGKKKCRFCPRTHTHARSPRLVNTHRCIIHEGQIR